MSVLRVLIAYPFAVAGRALAVVAERIAGLCLIANVGIYRYGGRYVARARTSYAPQAAWYFETVREAEARLRFVVNLAVEAEAQRAETPVQRETEESPE